jgi:hypothetical protein
VTDKQTNKAFQGMLTQAETNYVPLSATAGKACANCRWFMNDGCFIVAYGEPEPIIATGYCDRWETSPAPEAAPDMAEIIVEAVGEAVESVTEALIPMSMEASYTPPKRKTFSDRLRSLFTRKQSDDAFSVFKGTDGEWHFHAIYTNNFEDREDEILTTKGHDKFIARVDMGLIPMPVLQAWHIPGTEHGEADVIWRNDHFVHAIGHFYDTPDAQKAIEFYRKNAGKIKMSHGFVVPQNAFDGKHYDDFNTIEITTLPPYAAANPYTSFEELQTMAKQLTDEKRRYVETLFGKDKVAEIEAADEQRGKALEDMRIAYKDFADTTEPDAETPAPTSEQEKALTAVYTDLVASHDELVNLVATLTKASKAKDEAITKLEAKFDVQIAALQKDNEALRTLVNAGPRRASQDSTTAVKEGELKDALPRENELSNWLGLPIKQN